MKRFLVWFHRKILGELFCEISCGLITISVVIQWWPVVEWSFHTNDQQNAWTIFTVNFSQLRFYFTLNILGIILWKVLCGFHNSFHRKMFRELFVNSKGSQRCCSFVTQHDLEVGTDRKLPDHPINVHHDNIDLGSGSSVLRISVAEQT